MEVSSTTTTVKLPARTRVHVKLKNYKDPHVLSLEDTYSTAQGYVPKLIASRKNFLSRLGAAKGFTLPPCMHAPPVSKLWRASVPPCIEECTQLERKVLASMVHASKQWCMDQAQRRKDMHENWLQSALDYFIELQALRASETFLVTFIVKEMNGGKLLHPMPAYEQADTQYAQWLTQPKSPDVVERSKKYARAAAERHGRAQKVKALRGELESTVMPSPSAPPEPVDTLGPGATRCLRWIQNTAKTWLVDLLEHEDSLHMKRLNC
jgi:hypothetical protein